MGKGMNPVLEVKLLRQRVQQLMMELELTVRMTEQKMDSSVQAALDAAAIANSDVFQMGPGRAMTWKKRVDEILADMMRDANEELNEVKKKPGKSEILGDAEIPATRDRIDRRLLQIFGPENFQPFEERYHWEKTEQIYKECGFEKVK